MEAVVRDELDRWRIDHVAQINIDLFAATFTEAQLSDMVVFLRSPGGQALLAQAEAISLKRAAFGLKFVRDAVPGMVAATQAKLKDGEARL